MSPNNSADAVPTISGSNTDDEGDHRKGLNFPCHGTESICTQGNQI